MTNELTANVTSTAIPFAARLQSRPLRIIVDGPNYGGKSAMCDVLRRMLPGMFIIEMKDFCHLHALRLVDQSGLTLAHHSEWTRLPLKTRAMVRRYLDDREHHVIRLMEALSLDDILVERLILTSYVHRSLFLSQRGNAGLEVHDAELHRLGAWVIYVTASEDALIRRANSNEPKNRARKQSDVPDHLLDPDLIRAKSKLYEIAFELLHRCERVRLDTSNWDIREAGRRMTNLIVERFQQP